MLNQAWGTSIDPKKPSVLWTIIDQPQDEVMFWKHGLICTNWIEYFKMNTNNAVKLSMKQKSLIVVAETDDTKSVMNFLGTSIQRFKSPQTRFSIRRRVVLAVANTRWDRGGNCIYTYHSCLVRLPFCSFISWKIFFILQ